MTDCIFCKIVKGDLPADKVYEDDRIIAFRDINPKAATHLLVIPRDHVARLDDVAPEQAELISHMMLKLPEIAATQGVSEFRTIINNGAAAGQVVFHLHVHILGGTGLPGF